jgi:phosphoserine aminotransferase
VLEQAQSELLDHQGSHVSVLEMSHRSPEFDKIINGTIEKAKKLL